MRKVLELIITVLLLLTNVIYVNAQEYCYEWGTEEAGIPLEAIDSTCYVFSLNGEQYVYSRLTATSPIKYNKEEFEFFNSLGRHCHDYLWTGEYYMIRLHNSDLIPQSYSGYDSFPVRLYDKEFNLVQEYSFDKYVYEINYYNSVYYCRTADSWYCSTDFQNWEVCNGIQVLQNDRVVFVNDEVSINGSKFYNALYENDENPKVFRVIGDYVLGVRNGRNYVSLDNIYTSEMSEGYTSKGSGAYFYDDYLIYEGPTKYFGAKTKNRIYIQKSDIDNKLSELSSVPYVVYDDKILAFEQPPVIQDERTLIPIRFLFEQMGAEVTWNQEEQTATVTQDNTAITVGIDDTEAEVNGQTVSMDVPAQLINDKTMVPVRFLSEELGYDVEWDGENRIITIE